ncbi:MAG TPA: NAD+ synthase, partial [Acidimicrobiales bacterium]|nr:NAD+ synthase [Acidimicrobiales bacterium]
SIYNAAALIGGGKLENIYCKRLLPNYSVFDEQRYFTPGEGPSPVFETPGSKFGIAICEDVWYPHGPVGEMASAGATLIVVLNASPFYRGRGADRTQVCASRVSESGVEFVYVNQVGGQDELVFDGGSFYMDSNSDVVSRAVQFEEEILICDTGSGLSANPTDRGACLLPVASVVDPAGEVYAALVTGTRDYVRKNGFTDVVVGLSGGIDSSLVVTIAADAIGSEHVHAVAMPSRYSSQGSLDDAVELCKRQQVELRVIPIEPAHEDFRRMVAQAESKVTTPAGTKFLPCSPEGLADENLQSRVRGVLLMELSNQYGWLVLTTGNKSELAVGYSTLYGDTAGGFAVIKDVPKTMVYQLCEMRNRNGEEQVIPKSVIDKPPSAELRPDQRDDQSLPDYVVLDAILEAYIEGDATVSQLIEMGYAPELAKRIASMVDRSEYKRRQNPPGVRVTPKAFGKDRRMPITNRYLESSKEKN